MVEAQHVLIEELFLVMKYYPDAEVQRQAAELIQGRYVSDGRYEDVIELFGIKDDFRAVQLTASIGNAMRICAERGDIEGIRRIAEDKRFSTDPMVQFFADEQLEVAAKNQGKDIPAESEEDRRNANFRKLVDAYESLATLEPMADTLSDRNVYFNILEAKAKDIAKRAGFKTTDDMIADYTEFMRTRARPGLNVDLTPMDGLRRRLNERPMVVR